MKIPNHPVLPGSIPGTTGTGRDGIGMRPSRLGTGVLRLEVVQADDRMLILAGPGGLRLKAPQPNPPLAPGALVSARVLREGTQPLLEIRPRLEIALLRGRLRELPPPQLVRPPEALLVLRLIARSPRLARLLPPDTVARLNGFIAGLPDPKDLGSPETLQRAVRNSGQFLDARIATNLAGTRGEASDAGAALENDLGLLLRRLASALRSMPGNPGTRTRARPGGLPEAHDMSTSPLARLIPLLAPEELERLPASMRTLIRSLLGHGENGAELRGRETGSLTEGETTTVLRRLLLDAVETLLARQHHRRLQHLEQQESGHQEWRVEIPLRRDDLAEPLRLTIRRDGPDGSSGRSESERTWRVRLDMTLPVLGRLIADVSLDAKRAIEVHFLTPHEATRRALNTALPRLVERLESLGLRPHAMSVRQGTVPVTDSDRLSPSMHLLDEQA